MQDKIIVLSEELRLRPLIEDDAPELQKLADNEFIWRWVQDRFPHPYTLKDAQKYIEDIKVSDYELGYAIEFENKLVGVISLIKQRGIYRYSSELRYWIGKPYWNMGFATQAVKSMLSIAFKSWGLMRVFAFTMQGNNASQRVLEKAEFIYEGVRRKAVYKNGVFHDEILFSILKEEYEIVN